MPGRWWIASIGTRPSVSGQRIQRAFNEGDVRFHNMRINFRGFDVGVPHEFLNDTDIGATFKLMRGKTVAQGVTAGFLVDSGTG